jgi:adenine-specific DNA-methyltransferase
MAILIGANIKYYRQLRNITQRELADLSGVKYTTITKIETGLIEDPSFLKVSQISKALDITTDQLTLGLNTLGKTFQLKNRRFLGNKYKLLNFIKQIIDENIGDFNSFCDPFAGTGVVGEYFNTEANQIISNDLLTSNYVALKSFLSTTNIQWSNLIEKIKYLNLFTPSEDNYASQNFGGTYFSMENARKIGWIREEIEQISENEEEKYLLLTSLIYAMDKVANTVGHYDAYRKVLDTTTPLKMLIPDVKTRMNNKNLVFKEDANNLVKKIDCDILYLDPPYNSRQYSDAYHLLENIVEWKKPEVFGVAKKMDRSHIKSKYCLKSATEAFEDLILNTKAKHILLSYNSTGDTKHGRSNAKINDTEILGILNKKGEVKVFETDFKAFTTGKNKDLSNKERIFYCKAI